MGGLTPAARPVFDHLVRLTDTRGLLEHAHHGDPRPEHGYCVDDAARAVVVIGREPEPAADVRRVHDVCLGLCLAAVAQDGACHNRMRPDGHWGDEPGTGDWWGRTLWALGSVSVRGPAEVRHSAHAAFASAARQRSDHPRSMAYAALGAAEVLTPGATDVPDALRAAASSLLEDVADLLVPEAEPIIGAAGDPDWPWPAARLTYANAVLPEAMLAAGSALGRPGVLRRGLSLLGWLLDLETWHGHLSVTPVAGRGPRDGRPAYDQQPIEVAAIVEACARAHDLTGDPRWRRGVELGFRWFLGENDQGVPLLDPLTGAGYDGLTADGRNQNRGAESTLAVLATIQSTTRE